VDPAGWAVYLDFGDSIKRLGRQTIEERYGNLFDMYFQITGENPYEVPMRIYPAVHYTMGGLWVDYHLNEHHTRAVRARRGELLRSRRKPAGRERAECRSGGRLFVIPYTIGTTWLRRTGQGSGGQPEVRAAEAGVAGTHEQAC